MFLRLIPGGRRGMGLGVVVFGLRDDSVRVMPGRVAGLIVIGGGSRGGAEGEALGVRDGGSVGSEEGAGDVVDGARAGLRP